LLWAVLLHGEAGESLTRKGGPIGFLAREIADDGAEINSSMTAHWPSGASACGHATAEAPADDGF
jgi:hypothetical protein